MIAVPSRRLRSNWGLQVMRWGLATLLVMALAIGPAPGPLSLHVGTCAYAQFQIPEPSEPVCGYCGGVGCDKCQGHAPDDSSDEPDPEPEPRPTPAPATPVQPTTPVVSADPQQLFEQHKEALLNEFSMPSGLMEDITSVPAGASPVQVDQGLGCGAAPTGLSGDEWRDAADCQKALDELYAKDHLSADDAAQVEKLEAQRALLWTKGISTPGLTDDERDRLRMRLHAQDTGPGASVPSLSKDSVEKWLSPPPPPLTSSGEPAPATTNPVGAWLVGQFALGQAQGAVEFGGEQLADQILDENSYGDFLGVSKIALAYKEGGASSALAETANFLVGKIPLPTATIAVEGGRQYSNIVFQAQSKFMTDAMKATGTDFDKEKFWSDFNEDLNIGQKAVKEWVGYGTD